MTLRSTNADKKNLGHVKGFNCSMESHLLRLKKEWAYNKTV